MSDPIERQDVIDEAKKWIEAYNSGRGGQRERDAIKHVISGIKKLPSAQPKERTEERTETHACDLISRQAAINAVDEALTRVFVEHRDVAEKVINKIPSAQPEVLACGEGELIAQPEIVRCKDCTFYRSDGCFFSTAEIEEDGFCSWAERKTDG